MSQDRLLLLLRHAKAAATMPGTSEASDHARPLSERGRADAVAMGALIRRHGLLPRRALVSTALRTRETFALLGDLRGPSGEAACELVLSDGLYLAERDSLLEMLRDHDEAVHSLVLVGHNPGMGELAMLLAADGTLLRAGFPTCMLAAFRVTGTWSELAPGAAALLELLRP